MELNKQDLKILHKHLVHGDPGVYLYVRSYQDPNYSRLIAKANRSLFVELLHERAPHFSLEEQFDVVLDPIREYLYWDPPEYGLGTDFVWKKPIMHGE